MNHYYLFLQNYLDVLVQLLLGEGTAGLRRERRKE